MDRWRALKQRLHDLVFARDVADTADAIVGGTAESGSKGLFRNAVDALLYSGSLC
jgi:hypothetical protein